jgi:hypothetical protein
MENNRKIKYPRTFHLPYSEKLSSKDDRSHTDDDHFRDVNVIVSIKMDGENTTISNNYCHARSLDSKIDSEDRRWVDNLRMVRINNNLPEFHRICGENLFYKHTCNYNNLEDMFYAFSVWEEEMCLSWEKTLNMCKNLNIKVVPVIYEGIYDKEKILNVFNDYIKNSKDDVEGFVVRNSHSFHYSDFKYNVSKFVRNTFEIPPNHWRYSVKKINGLKNQTNPWDI